MKFWVNSGVSWPPPANPSPKLPTPSVLFLTFPRQYFCCRLFSFCSLCFRESAALWYRFVSLIITATIMNHLLNKERCGKIITKRKQRCTKKTCNRGSALERSLEKLLGTQQTHNVVTTSLQRRCNVMTLQRRCNDVTVLCVCWV